MPISSESSSVPELAVRVRHADLALDSIENLIGERDRLKQQLASATESLKACTEELQRLRKACVADPREEELRSEARRTVETLRKDLDGFVQHVRSLRDG